MESFVYSILKLLKNGCPVQSLSNNYPILDIIEFFRKETPAISDEIAEMHCQGMSISDIAVRTGFKRHAIWKKLKRIKEQSKSEISVPYDRWRKSKQRTGARPPFGFCILEGELVRDPKEYPTLLLIFKLWTKGTSVSSIVNFLAEKGLRSRTGKEWSYRVVQSITKRIDSGAIVRRSSKLVLSEDFLKGISSQPKSSTKKRK